MQTKFDPDQTIEIERDELGLHGEVIALMQMLKGLNTDLVVGMKLLESNAAKDHVSGASADDQAQREQLLLRAEKQREILANLKAQLEECADPHSHI